MRDVWLTGGKKNKTRAAAIYSVALLKENSPSAGFNFLLFSAHQSYFGLIDPNQKILRKQYIIPTQLITSFFGRIETKTM